MKNMALIFVFSMYFLLSNTTFAQDYIYDRGSYIEPYVEPSEILPNSNIVQPQNNVRAKKSEVSRPKKVKKERVFFEVGPKIGLTLGLTYLDGISFRGGLVFEMPFSTKFGIQLNLTYSLYNVVFAGIHETQPNVYDSIVDAVGGKKTFMHYVDINPFFKFYLGPVWFGIGPAFSLAVNGEGKQYSLDGAGKYVLVPQKSKSAFGVYFSFGGVIKTGDLVYLFPEIYATIYPFKKTPFAPDKTFRFLTTGFFTFGFNFGIGFKIG